MTMLNAQPKEKDFNVFEPTRLDYSDFHVPLPESFDLPRIHDHLQIPLGKMAALYAFRSKLRVGVDIDTLEELDRNALAAAEGAGGLYTYKPYVELSYCFWDSQRAAEAAGKDPRHLEAVKYAPEAYRKAILERWEIGRRTSTSAVTIKLLDITPFDWSTYKTKLK